VPKRTDIQKILIIGSGPIVRETIQSKAHPMDPRRRRGWQMMASPLRAPTGGGSCEFDYSGTQAVKALCNERCAVEVSERLIMLTI
jgi:hypothetical protein